jgi:hypothetical protein
MIEDNCIEIDYSFSTVGFSRDILVNELEHLILNYPNLTFINRHHWDSWEDTVLLSGYITDSENEGFLNKMKTIQEKIAI